MTFASLGFPPGAIDIPCVNLSTGAVTRFMTVVGGIRTAHTWTGTVDPGDGKLIIPCAPSTVANHSEVVGVAQETIGANGGVGQVRLFGATFIRVATNTANSNDACQTTTVVGAVGVTTAAANIFFYNALTAAQTFTFGSNVYTFSTAHAYGWVNTIPIFRLR